MHLPDELPYDDTDSLYSPLRSPYSSLPEPQDDHHLHSSYAHSTAGSDANVNYYSCGFIRGSGEATSRFTHDCFATAPLSTLRDIDAYMVWLYHDLLAIASATVPWERRIGHAKDPWWNKDIEKA